MLGEKYKENIGLSYYASILVPGYAVHMRNDYKYKAQKLELHERQTLVPKCFFLQLFTFMQELCTLV